MIIGMYIALVIALMLNMVVVFIGENRDNALEERVEMLEETVKSLEKWRWDNHDNNKSD